MKLLFKQRFFSWFDSYDVYYEDGSIAYKVEGKLGWGHKLHILDKNGTHIGTVQQVLFTMMPRFELYLNDCLLGTVKKNFTFLKPSYNMDFKGWKVSGGFMEWDYTIQDMSGATVAVLKKELFNFTDTYVIDVKNGSDAIYALMFTLAIDAEKCSRN